MGLLKVILFWRLKLEIFILKFVCVFICFLWVTLPCFPETIWHADRRSKRIYLTFDDGPHPVFTEPILRVLAKKKVKATFFVVGESVKNFPELVKKMHKQGHLLANHTMTHDRLDALDKEAVRLEIQGFNDVLESVLGYRSRFFRPPGGRQNALVQSVANELNMCTVLWDVNTGDYHQLLPEEQRSHFPYARNTYQKSSKRLVRLVLRRSRSGSIILLHNTDGETLQALPKIIDGLRKKGYQFSTLRTVKHRVS